MDVKALYPSIPKEDGIQACKEALDRRTSPRIPTAAAIDMIKTVLENNNFEFKDNQYIQTDGTAIGSRLAAQNKIINTKGP
jgi:hypothetical protein